LKLKIIIIIIYKTFFKVENFIVYLMKYNKINVIIFLKHNIRIYETFNYKKKLTKEWLKFIYFFKIEGTCVKISKYIIKDNK